MIKGKKLYTALLVIVAVILLIAVGGCEKEADPDRETSYTLEVQDVLGVTGVATFIETSNTESTITVELSGAPAGIHPAALYMNTVAEGGAIVVELNPVNDSGTSTTSVGSLSYSQLIEYDGFIKVLQSGSEPGIILAQGDIGGNVITDINVSYALDTIDEFGVSGTALFEKRENGNTLVTLSLDGTIAGEVYPATINLSSVSTLGGGPVTKTLVSIDGTTGYSYTNIRNLDDSMVITYDNWLVYNGYINIYQTAAEFENIISQGNIGSNQN
jgi:hypothetical protein